MTLIVNCSMWVALWTVVLDGAVQKVHVWAERALTLASINILKRDALNILTMEMLDILPGLFLTTLLHQRRGWKMLDIKVKDVFAQNVKG